MFNSQALASVSFVLTVAHFFTEAKQDMAKNEVVSVHV